MKATSLRPYLSNLTAKGYSTLFTGREDNIKLCLIDEQYLDELNTQDNGRITYKNDWLKPVDFKQILKPIAEYDIDLPLMQAVYSVFYQSLTDGNSILNHNTLTIKTTMLANYMNTNARAEGFKEFFKKLSEFNKVYAMFSHTKVVKFLTLIKLDVENQEVQFDVSLLKHIIDAIQIDNTITVKKAFKKEFVYELPTHSFLIHSSISRKNRNAYYLVTQIEALLVQAGGSAKEVHTTFENLIKKIPTLWAVLEDNKNTRRYKNIYLDRSFTKMYELLKTNTDLYEYFIDLSIPHIIPTQSELSQVLRITHKGINKEYRPKI